MTELTRLESACNQAHLLGDAAALDRIFADDIVIAVPSMTAMTKADALGIFRSGKIHFDKYATSRMRTRLYGDAAVVTGRLQRHRDMGGRAVDDDWQFTKVYIRRTAGWQVVSFHASPYAE
jgi:ketosteroid isomerase-like protein